MSNPDIEQQLTEKCDYVRITFDKAKKRPWRVEVWKCKRCRDEFVSATKEGALKIALERLDP